MAVVAASIGLDQVFATGKRRCVGLELWWGYGDHIALVQAQFTAQVDDQQRQPDQTNQKGEDRQAKPPCPLQSTV